MSPNPPQRYDDPRPQIKGALLSSLQIVRGSAWDELRHLTTSAATTEIAGFPLPLGPVARRSWPQIAEVLTDAVKL